jgi:hypothetical protein
MKPVLLAIWLAVSVCGVAFADASHHAAIVDMPKVITLSHASPDTWHTLPPVQPNDAPTRTASSKFGTPLVLGQVGRLQLRCDAHSTDVSRNSLSVVEFF